MLKKRIRFGLKSLQLDTIKYYLKGLYNKFDEDHIWILSSGIAFDLLICSIPFTLILFSLLGIYLSSEATYETIENYLRNAVGLTPEFKSKIARLIYSKIDEIRQYRALTAVIGTLGILWTASGLFSTLRDVLNRIFKAKLEVFYLLGKLKDIGMVFLTTLLFVLSLSATFIISILKAFDEGYFGNTIFGFGFAEKIISIFIGLIFSFIMFYIIYKIVPHGKINSKVVLVSSISTTILWEILKIVFSLYLIHFSRFTAIYGAYAAVVSVIFWIYYSSATFVIGAEIGQLYHEKKLIKQNG